MSQVQSVSSSLTPSSIEALLHDPTLATTTTESLSHTERHQGTAQLVTDTFERAPDALPVQTTRTQAPLDANVVEKGSEKVTHNFSSKATKGAGQLADIRRILKAMMDTDRQGPLMAHLMFQGLQTVHVELRGRGLVATDDTTRTRGTTYRAASADQQLDILSATLLRRGRDAMEAALRYYGMGTSSLPSYADFDKDPAAAWDAVLAMTAATHPAKVGDMAKHEAPGFHLAPGRVLWPAARANVSVTRTAESTHRPGSFFPPTEGPTTWKSLCEIYIDFAEGDAEKADKPPAFSIPLLAFAINNPDGQPVIEDTLPKLATTFAKRGRLHFERVGVADFAMQHTSRNRVQRVFNRLHLPGVGRALVRR